MTAEDKESLRAWAKNWYEGIGQVQARQALELLAENEKLATDRERLVQCLNDLVSSGVLPTSAVMDVDMAIAETVGTEK